MPWQNFCHIHSWLSRATYLLAMIKDEKKGKLNMKYKKRLNSFRFDKIVAIYVRKYPVFIRIISRK